MSDRNDKIEHADTVSLVRNALSDKTCRLIYAATGRQLTGDTTLVLTDFPTDLAAMQYDVDGLLGNAWLGSGSIATVTLRTAARAIEAGSISDAVFLSYEDGMYHDIGVETAMPLLIDAIDSNQ